MASLAASCGSDDRPGATATPPSTTIAVGNTNAPTTVTATAGQTVRGTGYSFSLPAGWRDVTAEAKKRTEADATQPDLAVVGPLSGRALSNVTVAVGQGGGGAVTVAEMVAATRTQLQQAMQDARLVGQPEQLSLAGTPATAHEYTFRESGDPVHGRQVICLRDDSAYVVTLVAHQQRFTTDRAAFDQIISSWSWG